MEATAHRSRAARQLSCWSTYRPTSVHRPRLAASGGFGVHRSGAAVSDANEESIAWLISRWGRDRWAGGDDESAGPCHGASLCAGVLFLAMPDHNYLFLLELSVKYVVKPTLLVF